MGAWLPRVVSGLAAFVLARPVLAQVVQRGLQRVPFLQAWLLRRLALAPVRLVRVPSAMPPSGNSPVYADFYRRARWGGVFAQPGVPESEAGLALCLHRVPREAVLAVRAWCLQGTGHGEAVPQAVAILPRDEQVVCVFLALLRRFPDGPEAQLHALRLARADGHGLAALALALMASPEFERTGYRAWVSA
jgi:hypothetical protein